MLLPYELSLFRNCSKITFKPAWQKLLVFRIDLDEKKGDDKSEMSGMWRASERWNMRLLWV